MNNNAMLPKDFYKKVDNVQYLKNVLYSDTDSVEIMIPYDKNKSLEDKWNKSLEISNKINDATINYLKNIIFPLANIDSTKNQTYFKTEALMESIGFLPDVKKYYTYKLLVNEGKFLDEPKVKYKNISIKSNLSKMSTKLLKDMIENVILNMEIPDNERINHLISVIDKWFNIYKTHIQEHNFEDIGIPNKWSKSQQIINAMRAYNLIMEKEIFTPGSAGKYVYCVFKNQSLFMNDPEINLKTLNTLAVPYVYDKELLSKKMKEYNIEVNSTEHWEKCIFTTTCHKLLQMIKNTNT
ncbi:MAG: hypothetical protein ACOC33_01850 [bacterium]